MHKMAGQCMRTLNAEVKNYWHHDQVPPLKAGSAGRVFSCSNANIVVDNLDSVLFRQEKASEGSRSFPSQDENLFVSILQIPHNKLWRIMLSPSTRMQGPP